MASGYVKFIRNIIGNRLKFADFNLFAPKIPRLYHRQLQRRRVYGCLPFSEKIRKFRLKVKWNSNFPFGNCRLAPEEVLFFRSEQNSTEISLPLGKFSSFQSLISRKQLREIKLQMVSAISFGWFVDFGKILTIIQRSSQRVHSDKW